MSRTLSGLFLVGALNRPRKRNGTNRENPRTIPEQIGKIPAKSGKSQKGPKKTKKEGRVQIGKPPRLKHPRLAALDIKNLHDNEFAELSGEFSGVICLKTRVLLSAALKLFLSFSGIVRVNFWLRDSLGNGRNPVLRVLYQRRELTEPH